MRIELTRKDCTLALATGQAGNTRPPGLMPQAFGKIPNFPQFRIQIMAKYQRSGRPKANPIKAKYWCFTINNWTQEEWDHAASHAEAENTKVSYLVMGKEGKPDPKLKKQATPHIQGYVELKNSYRMSWLKDNIIGKRAHVEKRMGTAEEAADYCKKEGDFQEWGNISLGHAGAGRKGAENKFNKVKELVQGGASFEKIREELPWILHCEKAVKNWVDHEKRISARQAALEKYKDAKLREWQRDLLYHISSQPERKVLWVVDTIGNSGKTWLANYLECNHGAIVFTGGKHADIAYEYDYQRLVVFDFSRAKQECVNYDLIEDFKNGRLFSPKYESTTKRFMPVVMVVFSNWEPDTRKLSQDRWFIKRLENPDKRISRKPPLIRESIMYAHQNGYYFEDQESQNHSEKENKVPENTPSLGDIQVQEPAPLADIMRFCDQCFMFNCEHVKHLLKK